eukprot:scaffold159484_cov31-Tisochrysis_lutea.AAC.5
MGRKLLVTAQLIGRPPVSVPGQATERHTHTGDARATFVKRQEQVVEDIITLRGAEDERGGRLRHCAAPSKDPLARLSGLDPDLEHSHSLGRGNFSTESTRPARPEVSASFSQPCGVHPLAPLLRIAAPACHLFPERCVTRARKCEPPVERHVLGVESGNPALEGGVSTIACDEGPQMLAYYLLPFLARRPRREGHPSGGATAAGPVHSQNNFIPVDPP